MPRERDAHKLRLARHSRVRKSATGTEQRPRLCVFRSLKHIYAQVIDDSRGHTIAAASSLERSAKEGNSGGKRERAATVGALVAQRAREQSVTTVIFDRGGYKYHGRVRALAEAAREGGLVF